jgi:SAM-dependent methyltransferase
MSVDYTPITELPERGATAEQLRILCTRYLLGCEYSVGKTVLEVACGGGVGLGLLARGAESVVGGDIEGGNCRVAWQTYRGRAHVHVLQLDAEQMPFAAGGFDLVLLFEAIYYLARTDLFLSEALRVLRPGGVLLVSTVNPQWIGFNPSPLSRRYYSGPELAELLAGCGLKAELKVGFPDTGGGVAAAVARAVKVAAVRLHLIPKTMKGKEWLKRLFYGRLTPIPRELTPGTAPIEPLVRIEEAGELNKYKMIYAVARKAKLPEDLK